MGEPVRQGQPTRYTFNYKEMRRENDGRQMKTVWRMKAPSPAEKRLGKHPTQKPIELIGRCLRASTNEGDVVLDPFAGSGSTGVAALELGRRFIGIEIDPAFMDVSVKRLPVDLVPSPAPTGSGRAGGGPEPPGAGSTAPREG